MSISGLESPMLIDWANVQIPRPEPVLWFKPRMPEDETFWLRPYDWFVPVRKIDGRILHYADIDGEKILLSGKTDSRSDFLSRYDDLMARYAPHIKYDKTIRVTSIRYVR